jgi:hypothetical protein
VIVRSAEIDDARQIATVHVDAWRAAYRDLLPEAVLRQFAANRERSWREILSGESEASPMLVAWTKQSGSPGSAPCPRRVATTTSTSARPRSPRLTSNQAGGGPASGPRS